MILQLMLQTFPAVRRRLRRYQSFLVPHTGPLATEAKNSIRDKEFHCLGGAVFAQAALPKHRNDVLDFIVAYQTISDYLDNLCDRCGITDQHIFRSLHLAMLDAVQLDSLPQHNYYSDFPWQDDGGYLQMLVSHCRQAIVKVPHYRNIESRVLTLAQLYIELQARKHQQRDLAVRDLERLYDLWRLAVPGLYWWEFAAVCGSTLGIFSLLAENRDPQSVYSAYLPWISGLHILLDYFIDQEEDKQYGDLNLVACYPDESRAVERISWFYLQSQKAAKGVANSSFHLRVIDGLLAMYLSDPKTAGHLNNQTAWIMQNSSAVARRLKCIAGLLRKLKYL